MKCLCCNRSLSDYESTRRHRLTGEYLDLCGICLAEIGVEIPYYDRPELLKDTSLFDTDIHGDPLDTEDEMRYP